MLMSSVIRVGFSCVPITPPPGAPMAGFAARTLPSTGVHDPLYVRAMVVTSDEPGSADTAVVVADLVSLSPAQATAIRRSIQREVGIAAAAVMVATTHTHGGPATSEHDQPSPAVGEYVASVREAAVRSVAEAMENKVPARMLLEFGHEPSVGKNRRRPGGIIDPSVPTIRVENLAGEVIGVVCCYACHPVTMGADNRLITADYPGAVVSALEAVYPHAVALFLTGCAGQINTGHSAQASLSTQPSNLRTFREVTRLGRAIAGAAVQASEHAAGPRGTPKATAPGAGGRAPVRAVTIEVEAPRLSIDEPETLRRMAAEWRHQAASPAQGTDGSPEQSDRLLRWAAWAERIAASSLHQSSIPLDVTAVRWGDICLVGLPGEPFVELGLEIRERAAASVVVAGYTNGCPGYVPHRSAYDEGGYEVLDAHRAAYGQPAAFAPEAGERLVTAALRAVAELGPFPPAVGT
jgi:neutral ceramidase